MTKTKRSKCPIFYDVKFFLINSDIVQNLIVEKNVLLLLAKANCNFIFINQQISIIPQKIFVLGNYARQNNK